MMEQPRQLTIVPFTPGYQAQVFDLIVPIQREEFGIDITAADQPDLRAIPTFYQQGAGNFWLALDGDQVVGTIALLDIGNGQAALRKMFVAPSHRGAAIGTAHHLLDALLDWARGHAVQEIYLGTTAKFLAAHRFYAKRGFIEIAQEALPAAFPIMQVDTKFFRLAL